jgi:adenosylmethionine-8-amino-7-oxononanoate aminotransferase
MNSHERTSDELRQSDGQRLLHSLHDESATRNALVWAGGRGAVLRDREGREYLDGLSGLWNVHVGHGRRELGAAAARQMETLAYVSSYAGATHPGAVELAERLSAVAYPGIHTWYFTCGGAEANETAIKTARYYWKCAGRPHKVQVISRQWAYHGVTLATMAATGLDWYWPMFEPRPAGFLHIASPYPYRFVTDRHDVSPGVAAADLLEEAILREGPDSVAAFLAEPVQGAGGVIVPPADYFPRIRQICDRYDVLFVADEVITGFGRTGRWFALEHWGVQPDIVVFAKGVTSGYFPLGGIGLSGVVAESVRRGAGPTKWNHAFTYSAHPVGCAVALANLDIIEREGLVARAATLGRRLLDGLDTLRALPHVGDVRGLGLMAAVELVQDKATKQRFDPALGTGPRVLTELRQRGLVTRNLGDVILLAPPLVSSEAQIDRIVELLRAAIATLG